MLNFNYAWTDAPARLRVGQPFNPNRSFLRVTIYRLSMRLSTGSFLGLFLDVTIGGKTYHAAHLVHYVKVWDLPSDMIVPKFPQ